jgi:hypothetical protein
MTASIDRFLLSALPALVLAIAGCGTTDIITTDPGAQIIVDGRHLGRGHGEIAQTGLPETSTVVVVSEDGRRETLVIERHFTGTTLLAGVFTYGICLIACWQYPDTVFVPLPGGAPLIYGQGAPAPYDPWLPSSPASQPTSPALLPPATTAPGPAPPLSSVLPPAPPPPPPPNPAHKRTASVVARSADVHSAPFNVAPVVVALAQGQFVLVEASPQAGWLAVFLPDGRVGYVQAALVKVDSLIP